MATEWAIRWDHGDVEPHISEGMARHRAAGRNRHGRIGVVVSRHVSDWSPDTDPSFPAVDLGIADTRALDAIAAVVAAPAAADAVERIRAILRSVNR